MSFADPALVALSARPVIGGRLCIRNLAQGNALVGVLSLPKDFVPIEGAAYLLIERDNRLAVSPTPLDQGVPEIYASQSVNELIKSPIWQKTTDPLARVVRFLQAFPESNAWTVFGPSHHHSSLERPPHAWFDVDREGQKGSISSPMDECGLALSQLLTTEPVWPNAQGTLHTLSQMSSPWRAEMLRYHQLLVQAMKDPDLDARLEAVVAHDPKLRELSWGRIDRNFCHYLAELDSKGLLLLDGPQTLADRERKDAALRTLVESLVEERCTEGFKELTQTLENSRSKTRRRTP